MTKDWREDYYAETIAQAAEDFGLMLTTEQANNLALAVIVSMENEGLASGRDCIPNPLSSEMEQLKRQHAKALEAEEARTRTSLKALARKLRIDENSLSATADGRVFYSDGRTSEIFP